MKIGELRHYLNSLSEDVLKYDVMFDGMYHVGNEKSKDIEIELAEIEYKETTRKQNEKDIKSNRCLYIGAADYEICSYESIVIISDDYKITDEDGEVLY